MLVAGYDLSVLQWEKKGSELCCKGEFHGTLPVEGPVEPEV